MSAITSPSPPSSALVEHISAHAGSLPSDRRLRPYFLNSASVRSGSGPPGQKGDFFLLPRRPNSPPRGDCGAPEGQAEKQEPQPEHRRFSCSTPPSTVF